MQGPRVVVGVALAREGRILAARRTEPAHFAGGWEFPGGKVEPGESLEGAAVREIREELGCTVAFERWLPGAVPVGSDHELRVCVASVVEGEPAPLEHDLIRWLRVEESRAVDWLPGDVPFVEALEGCGWR